MLLGPLSREVEDTNKRVNNIWSICIGDNASVGVGVRDDVGGEEVEGEYSVMISMKDNE